MPPDQTHPDILDYFLAGHSPSAIADALKLPIARLLETLKTPEARQAIADFEELLTIQARIAVLAARIPAISTLRGICTGDFLPAERRRAATELMRTAARPVQPVPRRPDDTTNDASRQTPAHPVRHPEHTAPASPTHRRHRPEEAAPTRRPADTRDRSDDAAPDHSEAVDYAEAHSIQTSTARVDPSPSSSHPTPGGHDPRAP